MRPTLVLVGGFLGAGKTSLLLAAAAHLRATGRRAAVITNDQGGELVDTRMLQAAGFAAEEITGGCFCCRYSDFLRSAQRLLALEPDVILAEPVGSCTDLSATILQPIKKFCGDRFRLAPLTVLVDPGRKFQDPELNWLHDRQIAEADLVRYSKADLYPEGQISARTGQGVAAWLAEVLAEGAPAGTRLLEIDYQRYAAAEAALGWLNWQGELWARHPLTPAALAGPLLARLDEALTGERIEIAHLKVFIHCGTGYLKAGICRNGAEPAVDGQLDAPPATRHSLIVNLRAGAAPEALQGILRGAIGQLPGRVEQRHLEAFRPAAPQPEHRFEELI